MFFYFLARFQKRNKKYSSKKFVTEQMEQKISCTQVVPNGTEIVRKSLIGLKIDLLWPIVALRQFVVFSEQVWPCKAYRETVTIFLTIAHERRQLCAHLFWRS